MSIKEPIKDIDRHLTADTFSTYDQNALQHIGC